MKYKPARHKKNRRCAKRREIRVIPVSWGRSEWLVLNWGAGQCAPGAIGRHAVPRAGGLGSSSRGRIGPWRHSAPYPPATRFATRPQIRLFSRRIVQKWDKTPPRQTEIAAFPVFTLVPGAPTDRIRAESCLYPLHLTPFRQDRGPILIKKTAAAYSAGGIW